MRVQRGFVVLVAVGLCWGCQEEAPDEPDTSDDPPANDVPDGVDDVGVDPVEDATPDPTPEDEPPEVVDAAEDMSPDGVGEPDVTPEPDVVEEPDVPEAQPSAQITSPQSNAIFESGSPILFEGVVDGGEVPLAELRVSWFSSEQGELGSSTPDGAGVVSLSVDTLSPGFHLISLRVESDRFDRFQSVVRVGICMFEPPVDFNEDLDPAEWAVYGDAFRDPGGWLEMTGLQMGRKGAIYNISRFINPGDVSISFKIWTGGGTGADGYAMNIFNVRDSTELAALFDRAASGGGLGYGIYEEDHGVESFHIEFDTWHNRINPNGDPFDDPTSENHVGVLLNADPGTHHLWAEIPTIEDRQWHDVAIEVRGSNVQVQLDGVAVIDGVIEGLEFKGGLIGFSGTTGFYTNFHRVDDLQIVQECRVP